jgi:hypothetical protein
MSQSTPLDMLDSAGPAETGGISQIPPADEERVKRLMAAMNADDIAQPPPELHVSSPRVISEPPLSTSMGAVRMDRDTARANVIGNSTPTMADFHSMFAQTSPGMAPFHGPVVVPGPVVQPNPKGSDWKTTLAAQLRGPAIVAAIVFLLNLPVVTSILSRHASWMYLSSGEISIGGLLVKSIIAATLFVVYQTISSFL